MHWNIIGILAGAAAVVGGLLWFLARLLVKPWLKKHPRAWGTQVVPPIGYVLITLMASVWLAGWSTKYWAPESRFADWTSSSGGLAIYTVVVVIVFSLIELSLVRLFLRSLSGIENLPPLPPELQASVANIARDSTHGIEILNDDKTPMAFVVNVLQLYLGMERRLAVNTMLEIHRLGSGTVPVGSENRAEGINAHTIALARERGHPLVCKVVPLPPKQA